MYFSSVACNKQGKHVFCFITCYVGFHLSIETPVTQRVEWPALENIWLLAIPVLPLWPNSPTRARAASFFRFLYRIQWHTTVDRTPLDEGSARMLIRVRSLLTSALFSSIVQLGCGRVSTTVTCSSTRPDHFNGVWVRRRGVMLTTHLHLVPRLIINYL